MDMTVEKHCHRHYIVQASQKTTNFGINREEEEDTKERM